MNIGLLVCIVCLSVTVGILLAQSSKFVRLHNADVRMTSDDDILRSNVLSDTSCLVHCAETSGCFYTSYYEDKHACWLHPSEGISTVSSTGWRIHFKVFGKNGTTTMNLKEGATAYQTTTYHSFTADLAIDGNKATNIFKYSCASPGVQAYWIMQFGSPGVVDKVDIYLRSDHVERNSNRKVWVAQTDDVASGTVCGNYTGPIIDEEPFVMTIPCEGPIFGKFLGIYYLDPEDLMEICEVEVFSP